MSTPSEMANMFGMRVKYANFNATSTLQLLQSPLRRFSLRRTVLRKDEIELSGEKNGEVRLVAHSIQS